MSQEPTPLARLRAARAAARRGPLPRGIDDTKTKRPNEEALKAEAERLSAMQQEYGPSTRALFDRVLSEDHSALADLEFWEEPLVNRPLRLIAGAGEGEGQEDGEALRDIFGVEPEDGDG